MLVPGRMGNIVGHLGAHERLIVKRSVERVDQQDIQG
jgi:hypothetical protein